MCWQHSVICKVDSCRDHVDTTFRQLFIWETLGLQPASYDVVDMVEVEENSKVMMRLDRPSKMRAKKWLGLKQNKHKTLEIH